MYPCHEFGDNQFNRYAVQQNLYATLLLDCYGMQLTSMMLVQLHEEQKTYLTHEVPQFMDIAREMLDMCSTSEQTRDQKRNIQMDDEAPRCKKQTSWLCGHLVPLRINSSCHASLLAPCLDCISSFWRRKMAHDVELQPAAPFQPLQT